MDSREWKYKIGSGKSPVILSFVMLALFTGLTIWLLSTKNGAFLFAGVLAVVMLLVFAATVHRFLFYKVLIGRDGFYYQTSSTNGKYYDYLDVEKAWISSGTAQNGAQEDYCNIAIPAGTVIRFQFFYQDKKGVEYLVKRVNAAAGKGKEKTVLDNGEYLIDGKVFGKTRIVIGLVLMIVVVVLDYSFIISNVPIYYFLPGTLMVAALIGCLVIRNLFFRVQIGEQTFYYRTHPFDGQQFRYNEIKDCREIKKVVRHGRKYRGARTRRYYFFFEFTDITGKTYKFQFEKPIHEHEVNVLRERIERARV